MKGYLFFWSLVIVIIVLLCGTTTAAPLNLPYVDYNCDGEISVADVLVLPPHFGSTFTLDLWAYDLDRDGEITVIDAQIVVLEIGRTDLPVPIWCSND